MRRALPTLLGLLGGVLVGAGVAVFWLANTRQWTVPDGSYAPLEPGSVLWTGGHLVGAPLVVAGLLVLAATAGWWLGRRGTHGGTATG